MTRASCCIVILLLTLARAPAAMAADYDEAGLPALRFQSEAIQIPAATADEPILPQIMSHGRRILGLENWPVEVPDGG